MKKLFFAIIICGFVNVNFAFSQKEDEFLKINKSFDVFGQTYYNILENYVIDIDPELLMKNSIIGMLNSLDPYTVYYDEKENLETDLFLQESFSGIGISVYTMDSMITITYVMDNYPAQKAGLRRGDRIYMIDSVVVLNITADSLQNYTRGPKGSLVNISILRDGINDTLSFRLNREEVAMKSVNHSFIFNDNIAFIEIDKFTKTTVDELRQALKQIRSKNKDIKGIILDLRNNPGGLLEAAVGVTEFFVPKSSLIVTTKTRNNLQEYEYKSTNEPLEPDVPLAVLINENSASAAEIVAGAIQDLDRGVILGKKSYGKGLVQNVLELPYNNAMKITTAKYYTPSGRCIQRIKFGENYEKTQVLAKQDTTIFYTLNGRPVYEATGIIPDSTIIEKETDFVRNLFYSPEFFKYANLVSAKLPSNNTQYQMDVKTFEDFKKYLFENNYHFESDELKSLNEISNLSEKNNYSDKIKKSIEELKKIISEEYSMQKLQTNSRIKQLLNLEIRSRLIKDSEAFEEYTQIDETVTQAREIVKSNQYFKILKKY